MRTNSKTRNVEMAASFGSLVAITPGARERASPMSAPAPAISVFRLLKQSVRRQGVCRRYATGDAGPATTETGTAGRSAEPFTSPGWGGSIAAADDSVNLALYANIWHELDDQDAALREAITVATAKGKIALLDWRSDKRRLPGRRRNIVLQLKPSMASCRPMDVIGCRATTWDNMTIS